MGKKADSLREWVQAGMPEDEESLKKYKIGMKELHKLEKRVMSAVAAKMLERPDVMTFAEHRTLQ